MRLLPLTTLLPLAAVGSFGAMWHYTNEMNRGAFIPDTPAPPANVRVVEVLDGMVRLTPLDGADDGLWEHDGTFGLEWQGGYARVGPIVDLHPGRVLREFTVLDEVPANGTQARLDTFVFRGDPASAHGIGFEEVIITGDSGEGPAWFVPGSGATWAIFVHGKGAGREEALRVLPLLYDLDLPILVITYRNDPEHTVTTDRYGYGETEWQDVAAAMGYARKQGAERFVLLGNSMGGGIVMATLQRAEYQEQIVAAVLDSPMLHLKRTIAFRASERGAPGFYTSASLQFSTWRDGTDWAKTDYLSGAAALVTPLLVIHGDADPTVPVATSDDLAAARPDLVTYHRLEGAKHVVGWNRDAVAYQGYIRAFLAPLLSP